MREWNQKTFVHFKSLFFPTAFANDVAQEKYDSVESIGTR
jgi:hypothetical protein